MILQHLVQKSGQVQSGGAELGFLTSQVRSIVAEEAVGALNGQLVLAENLVERKSEGINPGSNFFSFPGS